MPGVPVRICDHAGTNLPDVPDSLMISPTFRLKETLNKALLSVDQRKYDFTSHDDSPGDMAIILFRSIIMGEEVSLAA